MPRNTSVPEYHPCQCGCGDYASAGRDFIRGHDRRLYGTLLALARNGDESAHNELVRRGWTAEAGYGSYRVMDSPRHAMAREIQRRAGLAHTGIAGQRLILEANTETIIDERRFDAPYIPNRAARRATLTRGTRRTSVTIERVAGTYYTAETRGFGVEIETYGASHAAIARELQAAGLEVRDISDYGGSVHTDIPLWKIVPDSSIHGNGEYGHGAEVVSPVLRGTAGLAELRRAFEALRRAGCRVNQSTGLHVHHSADDLLPVQMARIARIYDRAQEAINTILAANRRSNTYCRPMGASEVDAIEANAVRYHSAEDVYAFCGYLDRYRAVNLYAYRVHRTIEFRQHQGTLNFTKVRAWVQLTRGLMEAVCREDIVSMPVSDLPSDLPGLLALAGVTGTMAEYLTRRASELATRRETSAVARW